MRYEIISNNLTSCAPVCVCFVFLLFYLLSCWWCRTRLRHIETLPWDLHTKTRREFASAQRIRAIERSRTYIEHNKIHNHIDGSGNGIFLLRCLSETNIWIWSVRIIRILSVSESNFERIYFVYHNYEYATVFALRAVRLFGQHQPKMEEANGSLLRIVTKCVCVCVRVMAAKKSAKTTIPRRTEHKQSCVYICPRSVVRGVCVLCTMWYKPSQQ